MKDVYSSQEVSFYWKISHLLEDLWCSEFPISREAVLPSIRENEQVYVCNNVLYKLKFILYYFIYI